MFYAMVFGDEFLTVAKPVYIVFESSIISM